MDEERQETADWRIVWQMFFPLLKSAGRLYVLGSVARGEMTDCAGCSRRRAFKCPVMRAGYVAHLNDK